MHPLQHAPGARAAGMSSVAQALAAARAVGIDRLDAQLLLAHRLQRPRSWLLAHDDAALPDALVDAYRADCRRRADDVPLAYLLGQREFHGLTLQVTPDVLVPRPDTETLVDWALELTPTLAPAAPALVDLGTGSGAIALALAQRCAGANVTATDLSEAALAVARDNAARLGLVLQFAAGSWWHAVAGQRFDLALSNPPYIAEGDSHLAALRHEPALALTAGDDGLDAIRAILAGAPLHLRPGAWLLVEHGWDQAEPVRALFAATGFAEVATRCDIEARPRCCGGRLR